MHWSEKYETLCESNLSLFLTINITFRYFNQIPLDLLIRPFTWCYILQTWLLLLKYYFITTPAPYLTNTPVHITTTYAIIHFKNTMFSSHYRSPPHSISSLLILPLSTGPIYRLWPPSLTWQSLIAIHLPDLSHGQEVHISDF